MTWFTAFLLTLASELPIVLLVTPAAHRRRLLPWFFVANATSHPALWALWPVLLSVSDDYHTTLLLGEAIVFSYEALIYAAVLWHPRGVAVAVAANAASMLLGLIINGT